MTTIFTFLYVSAALIVLKSLPYFAPASFIDFYINFACAFFALLLVGHSFSVFNRRFHKKVLSRNKAVLITGCDSGFGHELAKRLDEEGFEVFATCLSPNGKGAESLRSQCSDRLHVLYLDVTKTESILEVKHFVENHLKTTKLWAIVNNAGVYEGYAVDWTRIECFERCFDVNSLGTVRVTKAFWPLLKNSGGRVLVVESVAGHFALPYTGAYTMSQFATVAFTESLRFDLEPWNIKVISVKLGLFSTMMVDMKSLRNDFESNKASIDEKTLKSYGEEYFDAFDNVIVDFKSLHSSEIDKVINCLVAGVTLEQPNDVYVPCNNTSKATLHILNLLPVNVRTFILQCWTLYVMGVPYPRV